MHTVTVVKLNVISVVYGSLVSTQLHVYTVYLIAV